MSQWTYISCKINNTGTKHFQVTHHMVYVSLLFFSKGIIKFAISNLFIVVLSILSQLNLLSHFKLTLSLVLPYLSYFLCKWQMHPQVSKLVSWYFFLYTDKTVEFFLIKWVAVYQNSLNDANILNEKNILNSIPTQTNKVALSPINITRQLGYYWKQI